MAGQASPGQRLGGPWTRMVSDYQDRDIGESVSSTPPGMRPTSRGGPSPVQRPQRAQPCRSFGVTLLLCFFAWVIFFAATSEFHNEASYLCTRLGFELVRVHIRESGCGRDPMNDNSLVHLTCPWNHRGATDPGTGIHTSGFKIRVDSTMLQ